MFGRFEAEAPNVLWTGDVLHGPLIGGKKTYLVAFLDDHSRFITGYRWGWSEDSLHLAAAFKRAVAARGLPGTAYVDNGACFVDETLAVTCAKLGIRITHSPPYRPPLTGQPQLALSARHASDLQVLALGRDRSCNVRRHE